MRVATCCTTMLFVLTGCLVCPADAQDKASIVLAQGQIQLTPPEKWQAKEPRTRIVDYEFSVAAVEGDTKNGRATIMGAGGELEQNIGRWMAQFKQPDGKDTSSRTKRQKRTISGQTVHLVDIQGDYQDPFRPSESGANYRLLGAIIVTKSHGQYFVKLYGPARTIDAHEKAFHAMIESLKVKS